MTNQNWPSVRLKFLTPFLYGKSLSAEDRQDGEVPVFGSNGVVGYHNKAITKSPCIVIGRKGSYGKLNWSDAPCFPIDTTYFIDSRSTKHDLRWLYYALQILDLDKNSRDSAVPGLSREEAYNKTIPVPTHSDQKVIANFLDKKCEQIDKAIAKKKELIEKLKEKQNIIVNKTLAKGLISSCEFKETGIQWYQTIPQHWKMIKGKYIYKILSGYAFKSEFFYGAEENYPKLVTPGSFNPDGGLYFTERGTTTYSGEYHHSFLLKKNDLLVVMTDLSYKKLILGRFEYVDQDDLLLNQRIGKIIFNKKGVNEIMPDYLRELMNSDIIRDQVKLSSTGATVFHSSPEKIRSIPLPIPPLDEQKVIIEHLKVEKEKSKAAISKIQTEVDLLEEYKVALISESVTGKIDLSKMK